MAFAHRVAMVTSADVLHFAQWAQTSFEAPTSKLIIVNGFNKIIIIMDGRGD